MKDVLPVGTSFCKKSVEQLSVGEKILFIHRPVFAGKKEFPNAICILNGNYEEIGHLAESDLDSSPQRRVLQAIKADKTVTGKITELIIPTEDDKFKMTYKFDIDLGSTIFMKSWNEPDVFIEFNEESHTYMFDGETLLSPSKYADKDDFDRDRIAGYCSKSWDMPAADIASMWTDIGSVSAEFGQVVHHCAENYNKYSKLLPVKEKHRAIPKHKVLKDIITGYVEMLGDKKIEPEVFLSCVKFGLAGMADMLEVLDEKKKIANLSDIKVNIDSKKKIKKYSDQLFLYVFMLEQSGWLIKDVNVYAYDGIWHEHNLNHMREEAMQKIKKMLKLKHN